MRALKRVRQLIEANPASPAAVQLSSLVLALEGEKAFDVKDLYAMEHNALDLALQLLSEWRLDRHFSAKFRLMDSSLVAQSMQTASQQS